MSGSQQHVYQPAFTSMGPKATDPRQASVVPKHTQTHLCEFQMQVCKVYSISFVTFVLSATIQFQITPVREMDDMVLCHACKKSEPNMVATFDMLHTRRQDQETGSTSESSEENDSTSFSGHLEMYYFTADDEPVTILAGTPGHASGEHFAFPSVPPSPQKKPEKRHNVLVREA